LQERVQARARVTPTYNVIETEGPPHSRVFHVEVIWGERVTRGTGHTIKTAEMDAACRALEELEEAVGSKQKAEGSEDEAKDSASNAAGREDKAVSETRDGAGVERETETDEPHADSGAQQAAD
jgi:ribonuclease III